MSVKEMPIGPLAYSPPQILISDHKMAHVKDELPRRSRSRNRMQPLQVWITMILRREALLIVRIFRPINIIEIIMMGSIERPCAQSQAMPRISR